MREHIRTYTYDDGSGGALEINGARGFCADGQTLTNYIWGYLGNTVPPFNIKAYNSGDGIVTVKWDKNTADSNITGYKVYAGTSPGVYNLSGYVGGKSVGNVTSVEVTVPAKEKDYYFAVSAVDSAKGESSYIYEANVYVCGTYSDVKKTEGLIIY